MTKDLIEFENKQMQRKPRDSSSVNTRTSSLNNCLINVKQMVSEVSSGLPSLWILPSRLISTRKEGCPVPLSGFNQLSFDLKIP